MKFHGIFKCNIELNLGEFFGGRKKLFRKKLGRGIRATVAYPPFTYTPTYVFTSKANKPFNSVATTLCSTTTSGVDMKIAALGVEVERWNSLHTKADRVVPIAA